MDREAVADLLWDIEGLYSGKLKVEDDLARLEIWAKMLEDQDGEKVFRNLKAYALKNQWPPNISDLVEPENHEPKYSVPSYEQTMVMLNSREQLHEPAEIDEREKHLQEIRKIIGLQRGGHCG